MALSLSTAREPSLQTDKMGYGVPESSTSAAIGDSTVEAADEYCVGAGWALLVLVLVAALASVVEAPAVAVAAVDAFAACTRPKPFGPNDSENGMPTAGGAISKYRLKVTADGVSRSKAMCSRLIAGGVSVDAEAAARCGTSARARAGRPSEESVCGMGWEMRRMD